jgi:hypothetical protein
MVNRIRSMGVFAIGLRPGMNTWSRAQQAAPLHETGAEAALIVGERKPMYKKDCLDYWGSREDAKELWWARVLFDNIMIMPR